MSRLIHDIEAIVESLIVEHRKLLVEVEAQHKAVRTMNLAAMDAAAKQQDGIRLRIGALETRRQQLTRQLAITMKLQGQLTLTTLAELHPARHDRLIGLRDELKTLVVQIKHLTFVSGRVTSAVLGQLNQVVRLFAGAVEKAGLYTRHGIPQVSTRVGKMEAVG